MKKIYTLLICLLIPFLSYGWYADSLMKAYGEAIRKGDVEKTFSSAIEMIKHADSCEDREAKFLAETYLAQAYMAADLYEEAYPCLVSLDQQFTDEFQENLSPEIIRARCIFHNCMGVYILCTTMEYEKAIQYFYTGMKFAEKHSADRQSAILCSNLIELYCIREDPNGLQQALEIYDYGTRKEDKNLIYGGSYLVALMYFLKGDIENAKIYLEKTLEMSESGQFSDKYAVQNLYANIYYNEGKKELAEIYYKEAYDHIQSSTIMTVSYICFCYGSFLYNERRYTEAAQVFETGIQNTASYNRIYLDRLYRKCSEAYEKAGNLDKSLENYKKYHLEQTGILNVEAEKRANALIRKYENEKYQKELSEKSAIIRRILLFSMCIILLSAILLYQVISKNRLYTRIIEQYQQATSRQKELEAEIKRSRTSEKNDSTGSVVEATRTDEIYRKLCTLMKEEKIFQDKAITIDKLSQMLETNRTYLSQIIKSKTGLNFLQYINSHRIDEAITILSDVDSDIPLKALCLKLGYNSMTSFYNHFQEKVGMSPAKYRERTLKFYKSHNLEDLDK